MPDKTVPTSEERRLNRAAKRGRQRQANIGRARKMHLMRVANEKKGKFVSPAPPDRARDGALAYVPEGIHTPTMLYVRNVEARCALALTVRSSFTPIFAAAALASVSSNAAAAQPHLASYVNERYGYAVRYPVSLLRPVTKSSEGQSFASSNGHAGFRVFAKDRAKGSPSDLADDAQHICPKGLASYRVAKPMLVAVSCRAGDHIIYQKTMLRNGLEISVRGEYPVDERAVWDPVVTTIARSMSVTR